MKPAHRGSTRTVPQSDLQNKALGVGDPNSADKAVGKQNARWARVDLSGGGSTPGAVVEYDVSHDLGQTPTSVTLESFENAAVPGTFIIANGVRQENWSHSHAHVSIHLVSGSLDGCVAVIKVQGR